MIYDKQPEYTFLERCNDVNTNELPASHEINKYLVSPGLLTALTAGESGTGKPPQKALEGIYEFTASSGRTYVGQSSNIPRRMVQHIKRGKLLENDVKSVRTKQVSGGRIAREISEQSRIDMFGGIKNLENVRNVIGQGRNYLLKNYNINMVWMLNKR